MGRVGFGLSLSWAEFVMGRDVQLPPTLVFGDEGVCVCVWGGGGGYWFSVLAKR